MISLSMFVIILWLCFQFL